MTRQATGAEGEALAARYLQKHGYTIVALNWRCSHGEIDIVAQQDDVLIFCEVKTRRGSSSAQALANITARKREKLIAAAHLYLHENDHEDRIWRIDAIAVIVAADGTATIEHVEDALDW